MFLNHTTAFAAFAPLTQARNNAQVGAAALLETDAGWRRADTLIPGDAVATVDGGFSAIIDVTQTTPKDMIHIPAGTLQTCSNVTLPGTARIALTPPTHLHEAPLVSVPLQALVGWKGIRPAFPASAPGVTLTLADEEMIYAQTGLMVHAGTHDGTGFFETLTYGDTRALLTAIEGRMIAPDRAAA